MRRDERTGALRSGHDEHAERKAAHDAVAYGKMPSERRRARRIFGEQAAVSGKDALIDGAACFGIADIKSAAEHRRGAAAGFYGRRICRKIYARGKTGDD